MTSTTEHAHTQHENHQHTAPGAGDTPDAHSQHAGHDPQAFKRKFWLSLWLTIPTVVFSMGLQDILGLPGPRFPYSDYIPAVFGLVVFIYGGQVFVRGAVTELRDKRPGMMTLVALAIVVAFGYSLAVTLGFPGMDFWWELSSLITIMLLGHWIEMSAVMGAQNALGELAKLIPDEADRLRGKRETRVPVSQLVVGDLVLVRPGAAIPVDGDVIEGESAVNEALITGESTSVSKSIGSHVIAGSLNTTGSLTVEVTKVGADTAIAGIMKLVADAQASKSGTQLLAERSAAILFYIALASAGLTLLIWALISPDNPAFVIERVVTVLIIACPHALGLAIPLVAQISVAVGAKNGLLVRGRAVLEDARLLQVVVFDKTGTLTEGRQGVVDIVASDGVEVDELLSLAASVEKKSEHPIAAAIVSEAARRKLPTIRSAKFLARAGKGVEATLAGRHVAVANLRYVTERGLTIGANLVHTNVRAGEAGHTVVFVFDDTQVLGLIALTDVIRPESAEAVAGLQKSGIRVAMLTGDSTAVGNWVASQLGITEVFAEVLPAQKAEVISQLQDGGTMVAMVGDGVNDAPALAQADVGIALGAGTDVAIDSAGLVLASSDPRGVLSALTLSRATYSLMRQNLFWATGYNVVAIPLAAGVLFAAGIVLSPAVGAALMSISTIVVALNAQRLRRLTL